MLFKISCDFQNFTNFIAYKSASFSYAFIVLRAVLKFIYFFATAVSGKHKIVLIGIFQLLVGFNIAHLLILGFSPVECS